MSRKRLTGYTDSTELKQDVKRTVDNPDTAWDSESELVIHAVRKLLGDLEAEDKAAEYNVERRIEQKIDKMDRTIREAIRDELDTEPQSEPESDSGETPTQDSTDSSDDSGFDWADRDNEVGE